MKKSLVAGMIGVTLVISGCAKTPASTLPPIANQQLYTKSEAIKDTPNLRLALSFLVDSTPYHLLLAPYGEQHYSYLILQDQHVYHYGISDWQSTFAWQRCIAYPLPLETTQLETESCFRQYLANYSNTQAHQQDYVEAINTSIVPTVIEVSTYAGLGLVVAAPLVIGVAVSIPFVVAGEKRANSRRQYFSEHLVLNMPSSDLSAFGLHLNELPVSYSEDSAAYWVPYGWLIKTPVIHFGVHNEQLKWINFHPISACQRGSKCTIGPKHFLSEE